MASPERIGPGIHLVAGGIAGTVGAVITCPLEVVKTRLQSSIYRQRFDTTYLTHHYSQIGAKCIDGINTAAVTESHRLAKSLELVSCLRYIVENEGYRGLFKGLGPNLVGVAPSRAIYFFTYANMKKKINEHSATPDSHFVHSMSAISAGFISCTLTNPIWFIKTRLQLDQKKYNGLTCRQCVTRVYQANGIVGFWKGITASYAGIVETVIHFVIYEAIKAKLLSQNNLNSKSSSEGKSWDFAKCMFAAACSKTTATMVAYPHEVARTRLREEGTKYRNFFQTLEVVYKEEGVKGLYRGITTQLIRQIPNTAIMMATYEVVVYLYRKYYNDST